MSVEAYKTIRKFEPTEEKVKMLIDFLLNEPLYMSDEHRDREKIEKLVVYYLGDSPAMFYELGNFQGLLGFTEIVSKYKADVFFKLWDKQLWGPTFARELRKFVDSFMNHLELKRLSISTPDFQGAELAKKWCHFKVEGRQALGFSWNGQLLTNIMLRKLSKEV